MTLKELSDKLKEIGVPETEYFLHGLYGSTDDQNKMAMVILKGKYGPVYQVYFRERDSKDSIREFHDESEACEYFISQFENPSK